MITTVSFEQQIMQYAHQIQTNAISCAYNHHEAYPVHQTSARPLPPYENGVEYYYADIPNLYEPYSLLPDPADYEPIINNLRQAMNLLRVNAATPNPVDPSDQLGVARPEFGRLASGGSIMSSWTGSAAEAFKGNFLGPFSSYTENQFVLLALLKSAAEAHQAIWKSARDDVTNIAETTLTALNEYYGLGSDKVTLIFSILSSIAAIVGAPLGGLPAGVVAAIGAEFSMAGTAVPLARKGSDDHKYSATTAAQVIDGMKAELTGVNQRVTTALTTISENLHMTIGGVDKNQSTYFEAPRPYLTDMSTKDAETREGLGVPG